MTKYSKIQIVKVAIATFTILLLFLIIVSLRNKEETNSFIKIKLFYSVPLLQLDGEEVKLINFADSIPIIYHNNDALYQFPYTQAFENDTAIIRQEIRFKYFVHRRGETYGYYYDSLNAKGYKKISADSLLKLKVFAGNKLLDEKYDSLGQIIKDDKNYSLIEKYFYTKRLDQSYADTSIFYYTDRLKGIDYSFSKEFEAASKLKICKIRLIYNSQFYEGYSFKFPYREFYFELKEESVNSNDKALSLFQRFAKDRTDNKR